MCEAMKGLPTFPPTRCHTAPMKVLSALTLFTLALFFTGCASRTFNVPPQSNVGSIKRIWVERQMNDDHHIAELLVAELERHGISADFGPLTMMPEHEQYYLAYSDRWSWDFQTYLIELRVSLHQARNDKQLASSEYYQPGPITKGPPKMVRNVLEPLFGKLDKK